MQQSFPKILLVIALLLSGAGLGAYVLFPAPGPDGGEPVRMLFEGKAGNVLFDHQTHVQDYGIDCASCHHNLEDGDDTYSCAVCHEEISEDEYMLSLTDALHQQCIQCHTDGGAGPVDCAACHNR